MDKEKLWLFEDLLEGGDVTKVQGFTEVNRDLVKQFMPGGSHWLHFAAGHSTVDVVNFLIEEVYDINALNCMEDENALVWAAREGKVEMVRFLLESGARIRVESSMINPLFSCIPGADNDQHPVFGSNTDKEKYLRIAKLLIEYGIDTSLRYDMAYGKQIDALMFALIWQRQDIALLIASEQAERCGIAPEALLLEAETAVQSQDVWGNQKK